MIDTLIDTMLHSLSGKLPGLGPETIRLLLAGMLGCGGVMLLIAAWRILTSGEKAPNREKLPKVLAQSGTILETTDGTLRCSVIRGNKKQMRCEIIEQDVATTTSCGDTVSLVFPPMNTAEGRTNAFTASVGNNPEESGGSLILTNPDNWSFVQRRKDKRKKVADQQFIRVRLWFEHHDTDFPFQDATPHVGVNAFDPTQPRQNGNSVLNISKGGIALQLKADALPKDIATGQKTVLNIFMFSFKEKTFRPYWYAGEIVNIEKAEDGSIRLGLAFRKAGCAEGSSSGIKWVKDIE